MNEKITLGKFLRNERMKSKMLFKEIYKQTYIWEDVIQAIERDEVIPNPKLLKRFSGLYGVKYSKLCSLAGITPEENDSEYYTPLGNAIRVNEVLDELYSKKAKAMPDVLRAIKAMMK